LPVFGAPEWVMRTVVAILAAGFIPALGFAWAFELTPSGFKRDADVPEEQSIAPQTARRMERLFLSLLVLALAFFAFDKFILAPKREASLVAATKDTAVAQAVATLDAEKNRINARSIAVLPFTNMSGDAANEYFSDGISEEILNVLAGTPELQVAARTSSFSFKGKSLEVPEIAEQLNVRMVLEGSVRKQGDKVRITAQLIDASNGFHVWSETYDRDLTDIFAVQDEIAQAIGQTLRLGGQAGQVLRRSDLIAQAVVKRGEPVALVAGGGGFEVRMAGRALADAGTGEVVRVENLSSRRVLSGVVAAPGEVRVGRT
jgi:flagella basal body P-ring formation protein FlgA